MNPCYLLYLAMSFLSSRIMSFHLGIPRPRHLEKCMSTLGMRGKMSFEQMNEGISTQVNEGSEIIYQRQSMW